MVMELAAFFGEIISTMYPNTFFLALMAVFVITIMLIVIRSPASFTIMIAFLTFALIAGGSAFASIAGSVPLISSVFFPVLVLVVLIMGGALAYAFWRILGS